MTMGELANCPKCDVLFVQTQFRTVCDTCYKEEEKAYDIVYKFLRKRENRTAELEEVAEGTGVSKELIIKFIRQGRITLTHFPNLGYPCEKCGKTIREDRLCGDCKDNIYRQLDQIEKEQLIREKNQLSNNTTFYSHRPRSS